MRQRHPAQSSPLGVAVKADFEAKMHECSPDDPVWRWAAALWCFDRGDRTMIDAMIACVGYGVLEIPPVLQRAVDAVVTGQRKPRQRGKFKIPPAVALQAAAELAIVLDAEERVRADIAAGVDRSRGAAAIDAQVSRIATAAGVRIRFGGAAAEPIDLLRESHARAAAETERIAAAAGVSVVTLQALERDFRAHLLDLAAG